MKFKVIFNRFRMILGHFRMFRKSTKNDLKNDQVDLSEHLIFISPTIFEFSILEKLKIPEKVFSLTFI